MEELARHLYINGIDAVSQPDAVCVNLTSIGFYALQAQSYIIKKNDDDSGTVNWRNIDHGQQVADIADIGDLLKDPVLAVAHIRAKNAELTAKVA